MKKIVGAFFARKGSILLSGILLTSILAASVLTWAMAERERAMSPQASAMPDSSSSSDSAPDASQGDWEIEIKSGDDHSGHNHAEGEAHEEGAVEVPPDMLEPLRIVSAPVQRGDLTITLDLYGWVSPRPGDLTEIHAPIAGVVEEFLASPGDMVQSGSPLVSLRVPVALEWQKAILTSVNDQAQLKDSTGLLVSEGQAKVIQLLGELRVAAAEKLRLEEELALIEQAGSNAVPKRDINTKRGELRSAVAMLEAKRSLALAYDLSPEFISEIEAGKQPIKAPGGALPPDIRREVGQVEYKKRDAVNDEQVAARNLVAYGFSQGLVENLRNGRTDVLEDLLTVRAKQPGLVTEVLAKRQMALNPGDPILRVIDYRKVYVDVEVPELDLSKVLKRASDQIPVLVTGLDDLVVNGHVAYFDTSVHPDIRKAHLVIEVENLEGMPLRDHMAATVGVPLAIKENALSVPTKSILTDGFDKIVFLDEGEHFLRSVVKTGIETLDRVEVLEGISPEDKVVVSGARSLYLALSIPKEGADPHAGHAH